MGEQRGVSNGYENLLAPDYKKTSIVRQDIAKTFLDENTDLTKEVFMQNQMLDITKNSLETDLKPSELYARFKKFGLEKKLYDSNIEVLEAFSVLYKSLSMNKDYFCRWMMPGVPLKVELVKGTPLYLSCAVQGYPMPTEFTFDYGEGEGEPIRIWVSTEAEHPGRGNCCMFVKGRPEKIEVMEPNTKWKTFRENDLFTSNNLHLTLQSNTYMKVFVTYKRKPQLEQICPVTCCGLIVQ